MGLVARVLAHERFEQVTHFFRYGELEEDQVQHRETVDGWKRDRFGRAVRQRQACL